MLLSFYPFRDIIVANAHQEPGPEGLRIFDTGYLVAVTAFLLFSTGFPVVQFLVPEWSTRDPGSSSIMP